MLPILGKTRQAGVAGHIVAWASELSDTDSFRALQMGARGVIIRTQPVSALIDCLRAVGMGAVWLKSNALDKGLPRTPASFRITPRERQIVELVCEGLRNREIAERMSITQGTVKVHLMHIFEKTGMKDRFQLALEGRHLISSGEEPPAATESCRQPGQATGS